MIHIALRSKFVDSIEASNDESGGLTRNKVCGVAMEVEKPRSGLLIYDWDGRPL